MAWLSGQDAERVRARLEGLPRPVVLHVFTRDDRLIVPGRDPAPHVRETVALMEELAGLTDRVRVRVHSLDAEPALAERFGIARAPAIAPVADDGSDEGQDYGIRFYGLPAGLEFGSFLEAVEAVSAGRADLEPEVERLLADLPQPVHLQVFTTPT